MIRTIAILFALLPYIFCAAQNNVKLISWSSGSCDERMSSDQLINRISSFSVQGNELHLSIGFRDNCCAAFKPGVRYSNDTLYILTYVPDESDTVVIKGCWCHCCFSLDLVIGNMNDTSRVTMFKGERIYYSTEAYQTFPLKYLVHNGDTINRTNRYGANVGYWRQEYTSGILRNESLYPSDPNALTTEAIWFRSYHHNGQWKSYDRKDSTESWDSQGRLTFALYYYPDGKDTMMSRTQYYSNGQVKEVVLQRIYTEPPKDSLTGFNIPSVYERSESYYGNGQLEHQMGDTLKYWYSDGTLKKWAHGDTSTEYYHNGTVKKTVHEWNTDYKQLKNYLVNRLTREYHPNGQLAVLYLYREEPVGENKSGFTSRRYEWKWDETGKLIQQPENWTGPLPK